MSTAVTTFSGIALVVGIVIGQIDAHLNYRRKRTARIDACACEIAVVLAQGEAVQERIKDILRAHY